MSSQEQSYVMYRVRGLNPSAAARSAGYPQPQKSGFALETRDDVLRAISHFLELARQETTVNAKFTKDDATALYLEAHAKAANATEEIKAVDSLVKLHGLAEPEKRQVEITHRDQLDTLDDDELMKLAGHTYELAPEDYVVVDDA
ncbi:hypothetical protein ACPV5S_15755 [Vibrio astriarenae]